jgi:hypothetical protein
LYLGEKERETLRHLGKMVAWVWWVRMGWVRGVWREGLGLGGRVTILLVMGMRVCGGKGVMGMGMEIEMAVLLEMVSIAKEV